MRGRALSEFRLSRASALYLAFGVVVAFCYFGISPDSTGGWRELKVSLYCAVSLSAVLAIATGIRRHRPKADSAWVLLLASQLVYAGADVTFYVRHDLLGLQAYPSISDVLYLAHYPFLVAAIAVFVRRRRGADDRPAVIDGATLAVGLGLVMWIFLISPQVHAAGEPILTKTVSVLFPAMDVAVLAVAVRLVVGSGVRPRAFYLFSSALALLLVTDFTYGLQQLNGTYTNGNFLDAMWLGYYLLLGATALDPSMRRLAAPERSADQTAGPVRMVALGCASLMAPACLVIQYLRHQPLDVLVLGGGAAVMFLLVMSRMHGLVAAQRRAAVTDGLTGLYNRRFLEAQLRLEGARRQRSGGTLGMFILDIDHFKQVNDTYGHPGGDRVLHEVGERLLRVARQGDVVARYGGEEFAVLALGLESDDVAQLANRLREAISGTPHEVTPDTWIGITASVGAAAMPMHTEDPGELVVLADRALYAAKNAGRDRAVVGACGPTVVEALPQQRITVHDVDAEIDTEVIEHLRALADHMEGVTMPFEHSSAVGHWAGIVAQRAGLGAHARLRVQLAGRLHDIGKVAVPPAILTKPGSLTKEERRIVRMHAANGARLLRSFRMGDDIARIVEQHHEWYDGTGYPNQVRGEDIVPEARIIAICDAYAAMRSPRPYRKVRSVEHALRELAAGRGRQFDPDLVDLFVNLVQEGAISVDDLALSGSVATEPSSSAAAAAVRQLA